MLNKIEFSDLYKFLTSIGLIIIAASFLIPWLFMKQEIGLLIPDKEYNELIESSKNLTDSRIRLGLFVTKAIPYISGILFILGVIISGIGLWNWKKKQDNVDETDKLKLTELKAKIKELNTAEILEKAEQEVKNEIEDSKEINQKEQKVNIEELKSNLIDMEKLFFHKMVEFNSFVYEPKSNVKIEEKYKIDILLKSTDYIKYPDIFIEIKYIQSKLNFSIVREAFGQLVRAYQDYTKGNSRKLKTILIVVYKSNVAESSEINRFAKATYDYANKFKQYPHEIILMSDIEAKSFNITKIIK